MITNKVEIHGDVAFIYITRAGVEHIAIVNASDLRFIDKHAKVKLTLDSGGYVQHKQKVNGKWEVFQLHRLLAGAFTWERVSFLNGNKLDLRISNLKCECP